MKIKNGFAKKFPMGTLLAVLLILISWSLLMALGGENPFKAIYYLFSGAFKNTDKIFSVCNLLFILILTAFAYGIPAWTGMYNIGGDGQLVFGGFCAAIVPLFFNSGITILNIATALIIALLAGGLWALWPALIRVKYGINEIVTTLLSNYIIINFTEYMVNYPFRSVESSFARTEYIPDNFRIPDIGNSSLSVTLVIALGLLLCVEFFRRHTIFGYQYRVTGSNLLFAQQGGVNVKKVQISSMFIGGAFAGLAGGLLVLATNYAFSTGFSPGYGYTGLLVSLIAADLPIVILVISTLFASLQIGAINLKVFTNIPSEITGVLQSIMVFFIAARKALNFNLKRRRDK